MKIISKTIALLAVFGLSGCIATLPQQIPNSAIGGGENIASAIRKYDNERPGIKKICLTIDPGFNYATGEFSFDKKSYGSDDKQARWDHLARVGLFSKTERRNEVVYKITQLGRTSYNDGKCSTSVERYQGNYTGPAFVYGVLELDRIIRTKKIPYSIVYATAFTKNFTRLETWATDKELRRAWKLQGIEEIQKLQWYATYKLTSNGVDFQDSPQLGILQ